MARYRKPLPHNPARRRLLLRSLSGAGLLVTGGLLAGCKDGGNVELGGNNAASIALSAMTIRH